MPTDEPEQTIAIKSSIPEPLVLVLTLVSFALLVCGVVMAASLWRVLPFYDSWTMITTFMHKQDGTLSFCRVIEQQNEHRVVVHRLLAVIDFEYFRSTHRLLYPILIVSYLVLGAFLGLLVSSGERAHALRPLIVVSAMALMVSPLQLDNLVQPMQSSMAHAILFSGIAFLSIGKLAEGGTQRRRVIHTAISIGAVILSTFSMMQGLIGAGLAVSLAFLLRVPAASRVALVAAVGGCIILYFFWPCGYRWPVHHQPFFAHLHSYKGVAEFGAHVAIHLGLFGAIVSLKAATIIGYFGLSLWLLVLAMAGRQWFRSRQVDAILAALIAISTLMVAVAVVTALGRAGFGIHQAASSRYTTEGLIFWYCLFGTAWRHSGALDDPSRLTGWAERTSRALRSWRIAPSLVIRSFLICIGCVVIVPSYLAWFSVVGESWRHVVAQNRAVAEELRMGIFDPEHVRSSYPAPDSIRRHVQFLRENKLSIFAE